MASIILCGAPYGVILTVGAQPPFEFGGNVLHSVGFMRIVRQDPVLATGRSLAGAPPEEGPKWVPPSKPPRVDCHPRHTAKTGCPLLSKNLITGQMSTVLYSAVGAGSVSNVVPITFIFPASTVADDELVSAPSIYILTIYSHRSHRGKKRPIVQSRRPLHRWWVGQQGVS